MIMLTEDDKKNIKACPFCNGYSLDVCESKPANYVVYHVLCKACMAQGPKATNPMFAFFEWNTRHDSITNNKLEQK